MRRIQIIALSVCAAWGFAANPALLAATNSKLKEFVSTMGLKDDEGVMWVVADINGDGNEDLLITSQSQNEAENGDERDYNWAVYSGAADGRLTKATTLLDGIKQGSQTIRMDRYWVGYIPEIKNHGLLHLVSGMGGHAMCQLHALILTGETFTDVPIGEPVSAEDNFKIYDQRIQSKGHPTTSKATAAQVRQLQSATKASPKAPTDPIATPPAIAQPTTPKKAPESESIPTISIEEPISSTPWSIILVLILAATGLLWLLVKRIKR